MDPQGFAGQGTPYGGTTGAPLAPAGAMDPQGFPAPPGGGVTSRGGAGMPGGPSKGGGGSGSSGSGAKPPPLTQPQTQQLQQLKQLASANLATQTQLRQLAALVTQQRAAAATPIYYRTAAAPGSPAGLPLYAGATQYGAPIYGADGSPGAGYGAGGRALGAGGLMMPLIIGGVLIAFAMHNRAA